MQIKKQLAFLIYGLLASFGAESATATLQVTYIDGVRTGSVPLDRPFYVRYNITNLDSKPHHIHFRSNWANALVTQNYTEPCGPDPYLLAHASCTVTLGITPYVGGRIVGGPYMCIERRNSACSQPNPSQVLDVSIMRPPRR